MEEKEQKAVSAGNGEQISKKAPKPPSRDYDKYAIPADWDQAKLHYEANLVGEDGDEGQTQACGCCGREDHVKLLPLTCQTIQLSFLGAGFPLFFEFIKYSITILLILLLSSGSFNVFSNIMLGQSCYTEEQIQKMVEKDSSIDPADLCHWSIATAMSLANQRANPHLLQMQEFLNVFSIASIIVVLQFFRTAQRAVAVECDYTDVAPADYTVVIQNLPVDIPDDDYEIALTQFLEKQADVKVVRDDEGYPKISLAYNIGEINDTLKGVQDAIQQKQDAIAQEFKTGQLPDGVTRDSLDKAIKQAKEKDHKLREQYASGQNKEKRKSFFSGWAFVSVRTEAMKTKLIEENNISQSLIQKLFQRQSQLKFKENWLFVEEATDPTDVFWDNLHVPTKQKYINRVLSFFVTVLTLCVCVSVIIGINVLQQNAAYNAGTTVQNKRIPGVNTTTQILGAVVGIVVQIMNFILTTVLKWSSSFEAYSTRTLYNSSMATKTSIAMFFNTALINFGINIIYLYFTLGGEDAKEAIFKPQGLVEVQQSILISNAWIPVLVYLVDPARIAKKVFLELERRKGEQSVKTQLELNEMMEEPAYDISVRYPIIINSIFVTAFYAPLIPLALVYGCLGLAALYWAEKYKILRHRSIKNDVGSQLSFDMTELLETLLPLYCAANLMFDFLLSHQTGETATVSTGAIVGIIVGVVHMFLPMQEFNNLICFVKSFPDLTDDYDQSQDKFDSDYDMENPVTSKQARAQQYAQQAQNIAK